MITILLLGALFALAFGVLIFQALRAPEGHEDATGFHYDRESAPKRSFRSVYQEDSSVGATVASHHIQAT